MEAFEIGKFIKEFRERKNISQEDLTENLCAVSTLSRIERGIQYPSRTLLEAFFNRLGYANTNIRLPLSTPDFKRSVLEYEIMSIASRGDPSFIDLLPEYKNVKDEMDILETQFYSFFTALHKTMTKSCPTEEILNDFLEVIHITFSSYKIDDDISKHLLTKIELMTLLNIARTKYYLGETEKAIVIMEQLKKYYTIHEVSGEDLAANLPTILFNLSNWYGKKGLYDEAIEVCNEGIKICSEYGKLHLLPFLIFNKGFDYLLLGEISKGISITTTGINLMIQIGKTEDAKFGIESVKNQFKIDITTFN